MHEWCSVFLDALTYPCSYVVEKRLVQKYGVSFTDHLAEGGKEGGHLTGRVVRSFLAF